MRICHGLEQLELDRSFIAGRVEAAFSMVLPRREPCCLWQWAFVIHLVDVGLAAEVCSVLGCCWHLLYWRRLFLFYQAMLSLDADERQCRCALL